MHRTAHTFGMHRTYSYRHNHRFMDWKRSFLGILSRQNMVHDYL